MKETIFITGATGFLGAYLLRKLLYSKNRIIAISRGKTQEEAERRVQQSLRDQPLSGQRRIPVSLLEVVRGDIAQENLGLSRHIYNRIMKKVTIIYHSAALCDFNVPLSAIRRINVGGTKSLLEFALSCKENGQFKCFHHISTVAVAGDKKGVFYENELDAGQSFNNTYEQSKFEAEKLIEKYRKKKLSVIIYRPAIITGDTVCGYTSNFRMLYQPLHLFCLGLFEEFPAEKRTRYSLCPADSVAEAIVRVSMDKDCLNNETYHITNPNEITLDYFIDAASRYFNFQKPRLVPKERFSLKKLTPLQFSLIEPYVPYFNYKVRFDCYNAQKILKKINFKWPNVGTRFLKRLFKFCIKNGFISHKKQR